MSTEMIESDIPTDCVATFTAKSIGFESASTITSMLSDDEKALYYEVARSYSGQGAVLEVGPWLGSGTVQICRGLEAAGHPWSLTVVDRFRWSELYERRYPEVGLRAGETFLPNFRRNLEQHAARVAAVEAELVDLEAKLPDIEEVEIFFVDAPKSWTMLWSVLNYIGPKLLPGARLVFQDFLHITSRQLIWLLASVPQLRLDKLVESGTAAAFVADGPIDNLQSTTPQRITALTADDLMRIWRRMAAALPEARRGELAAGMALDLLQKNALDLAVKVLDEGAMNKPWAATVAVEVDRLIRYSDKKTLATLVEVASYLKYGVHPELVRAARAARLAEQSLLAGEFVADSASALDRDATWQLAQALRNPACANALAIRFAMFNPVDQGTFLHLPGIFEAAVHSGALVRPGEIAEYLPGQDVVELNTPATLHGVVMRALGAKSYRAFHPAFDPAQRTYCSSLPTLRYKTKLPIGGVCSVFPGFAYVSDLGDIESASADLVIVNAQADMLHLQGLLGEAIRVVRPGRQIMVRWTNPYAWSGHGREPRYASEIDKTDLEHRAVLDWRHLNRLGDQVPTLAAVRAMVESRLAVQKWTAQIDDPDAIVRLTATIAGRHPKLSAADFVTQAVTAVGTVREADSKPTPAAKSRRGVR